MIGCGSIPSDVAVKVPVNSRQFLVGTAGRQHPFAFRRLLEVRRIDAFPFHANALDAEIVAGRHSEAQMLRIQDHFPRRQPVARNRWWLVGMAIDRQDERFLAREPETVLPLNFHLAVAVHDRRGAGQRRTVRIDLTGRQLSRKPDRASPWRSPSPGCR